MEMLYKQAQAQAQAACASGVGLPQCTSTAAVLRVTLAPSVVPISALDEEAALEGHDSIGSTSTPHTTTTLGVDKLESGEHISDR